MLASNPASILNQNPADLGIPNRFNPYESDSSLLLSVTRLVADQASAIALYLTSNARWRAIQSCRDLPDRAAIGLKSGNLASVVQ
jgi:hypothetical protein